MNERLTQWSIDSDTLSQAVLAMLDVTDSSKVHILNDWDDLGSETLVQDFLLYGPSGSERLIAKKCIKKSPEQLIQCWFRRREVLAKSGIIFSTVRAVDSENALWVEEFVPFTFEEAYKAADGSEKRSLEAKLTTLYTCLIDAGFKITVQGLHDLRSHGEDVVMVDTGMDIGGQRIGVPRPFDADSLVRRSVAWNIGKCGVHG